MHVEPFDGESGLLSRLVADWAFKPYRSAAVSAENVRALSLARLRQSVARDGARTWTASASGSAFGLATLEPLPWDSRMLRRPAARAEVVATGEYGCRRTILAALIERVLDEAQRAEIEHLSVRVDAADDAAIHALETAGFLSVDALLTFERPIAGDPRAVPSDLIVREAVAGDAEPVGALAGSSFLDGRFHADPSIDAETAAAVYREWAGSCCRGSAADGVLVAVNPAREIVGFVACRIHSDTGVHLARLTASIVLIATAPEARRQGVGRAIVMAALGWAERRSVVVMQVGTQIRNTAAARLYEQCGFRLAAASQSFRAVIDPHDRTIVG
jgi:dTDP-4-amino-4,6-dideoxy-D-galactose acyltransferase